LGLRPWAALGGTPRGLQPLPRGPLATRVFFLVGRRSCGQAASPVAQRKFIFLFLKMQKLQKKIIKNHRKIR
jgi:hypothetical protein